MSEPGFRVEEVGIGPTGSRVRVEGRLTAGVCGLLRAQLERVIRAPSSTRIDVSGVEELDGAAAAILAEVWSTAMLQGAAIGFEGGAPRVRAMLDLYTDRRARACLLPPPAPESILAQIGRETLRLVQSLREALAFVGESSLALAAAVRNPSSVNWRDLPRMIERHGADGVPIVSLIAFLIGLITAFQAAVQLRPFGADSLVADLVGLSLTRELAPLMTAIVVAGRSGAAIAAELGTMKVSEEIDALRTLGLCPVRYLVAPRTLALVVVLPLLTLMADVVGIGGGLLVTTAQLEVSPRGYLLSIEDALDPGDVLGGVLKAAVFGLIVALSACERGLATRGGAEGVGRSTTSAVVSTLFYLVLADALFSVLFDLLGI